MGFIDAKLKVSGSGIERIKLRYLEQASIAAREAAEEMKSLMETFAPADTGYLREHISVEVSQGTGGFLEGIGYKSFTVSVDFSEHPNRPNHAYDSFQEFGTEPHGNHPGNPPHPFIYPSIEVVWPEFIEKVKRFL